MDFTRESIEAWERYRAEAHDALIAFCDANDITVERLMASRAIAVERMRAKRKERWVTIDVANPRPLHHLTQVPERDRQDLLDAAFVRYVAAGMRRAREQTLGPRPKRWRVFRLWQWNRKRRTLERRDEQLVAAMVALREAP